jgi:exonuclease SbcC
LGSEHFEELSGGRYRFTDDGTFGVVDLMAAEQVRASDSLSGGETFLASLGLALALAEMVSRQGGRLDAFFLDEGFGSLDAEHLDLAMSGVERLVTAADRLVVVVSHVAALRDRIEDLVVLDKDELTGDTRVLEGAGPPA